MFTDDSILNPQNQFYNTVTKGGIELLAILFLRLTFFFRPAIPNSITEEIRKKIPQAIFTSNPCRIQYCTQEIVIFREDIVTKMCRNCVKFPEDGEVPNHVSCVSLNLF